jgi:hypothetical protein
MTGRAEFFADRPISQECLTRTPGCFAERPGARADAFFEVSSGFTLQGAQVTCKRSRAIRWNTRASTPIHRSWVRSNGKIANRARNTTTSLQMRAHMLRERCQPQQDRRHESSGRRRQPVTKPVSVFRVHVGGISSPRLRSGPKQRAVRHRSECERFLCEPKQLQLWTESRQHSHPTFLNPLWPPSRMR